MLSMVAPTSVVRRPLPQFDTACILPAARTRPKFSYSRRGSLGLDRRFWAIFEQAEADQAFGRGDDGFFVRARVPAEDSFGLGVGRVLAFAELGENLLHGRVAERGEPHDE